MSITGLQCQLNKRSLPFPPNIPPNISSNIPPNISPKYSPKYALKQRSKFESCKFCWQRPGSISANLLFCFNSSSRKCNNYTQFHLCKCNVLVNCIQLYTYSSEYIILALMSTLPSSKETINCGL